MVEQSPEATGNEHSPGTDDARLMVMRLLEREPQTSQRDLARRLGVSLGKTHYLLQALLAKGWVKVRNFERSDHKLAYIAACIGKSESYVCRMANGERPIPAKLVRPLCVATGSNLLAQYVRLQLALNGTDPVALLAEQLRAAA